MKKCPECGNPSYDGARICGNCGYEFPKPKVRVSREDNIFKEEPKVIKSSNDKSTVDIIKENKIVISVILLITLIVIGIIIVTGPTNNDSSTQIDGLVEYSANGFSFNYPSNWQEVNGSDVNHEGAIFFKNNNTLIEYYNVTSDYSSLKEVTQERISYAQLNGYSIDTVQTITLNGVNASDIIFEDDYTGNYTRFVSMLGDGELFVFKLTGDSLNAINSDEISTVLNSSNIL